MAEILEDADGLPVGFDVKRLRLRLGDILVLRCDSNPTPEAVALYTDRLTVALGAAGHGSVKVIVMGPQMRLEVLGRDEAETG